MRRGSALFFVFLLACGVGHPANATVFRLLSVLPASLFPFCAGVPAIGVGQPDNITGTWFASCPM
jgi:hypothetical protein